MMWQQQRMYMELQFARRVKKRWLQGIVQAWRLVKIRRSSRRLIHVFAAMQRMFVHWLCLTFDPDRCHS